MSSIVRSQPINGVQHLNLGQYQKKAAERDTSDFVPADTEVPIDGPPQPGISAFKNSDAELSEDGAAINTAYRLAFEDGYVQGMNDVIGRVAEREKELDLREQNLLTENEEASLKKEAIARIIAALDSDAVAKIESLEPLAVAIAARAVKELLQLSLVSQNGILQLISSLVEKFRSESPVLEIRCGKFVADLIVDSQTELVKVIHDERRGDYEFELRTLDSFYSVDVQSYVTAIFDALSVKAPA